MKIFKHLFFVITLLTVAIPAFADFEVRGHYTYALINPSDLQTLNQASVATGYPKQDKLSGFGADALYFFPVMNLGLGFRYDLLSNKVSGSGVDQTITANRGALLVGYRLINTGIYLGALASYGITHDMKIKTTTATDLATSTPQSYSLGVEGGLKLGRLLVGAEVGYLSFIGKDINSNGAVVTATGSRLNLDLSGVYLSANIGVNF